MHYIITEKNTTARRIAAILSDGKVESVKIGSIKAYKFDDVTVMGLQGHVVGFDFPKNYKSWKSVPPQRLVNAELVTVPLRKDVVAALRKIAKDATLVTIATDYDREGELIGVEALRIIKAANPHVRADRMRYSAITEKDIKESFANRTAIDYNLAAAAEAREIIDLVWGASLTRFVSLAANSLGKDFLSVGRVQSPALALVVDREREIEAFTPQKYYEVYATARITTASEAKPKTFEAKHPKKFWERAAADDLVARLKTDAVQTPDGELVPASVVEFKVKRAEQKPPIPFNTTEFLRAAASIGFSPMRAMRIAESLYLRGFISYHRTDNTVYPETIRFESILEMLVAHAAFKKHAEALLKKKTLTPTAGKKRTTDHPPIHPVALADAEQLDDDEWRIYELVVRRFLATLSEPALWESVRVKLDASGEIFRASGRKLLKKGFLDVYPYVKAEEKLLPKLNEGDVVLLLLRVEEKETKPPKRFTQGALIKKMEELGIGTKSTRHEILAKLYQRGYVRGNPLKPTKKAFAVVESLRRHAEIITQAEMTKSLEEEMDRICEGKKSEEEVINKSKELLSAIFDEMATRREEIRELLRTGISEDAKLGACPKCGGELLLRRSKKGNRFIGCSSFPNCDFSLPLPKSGYLVISEERCEVHGLPKMRVVSSGGGKGGRRRVWQLGCPYCSWLAKNENSEETKNDEQKGEN